MTDQVALVTGASRGIGEAILHDLGGRGITVIGTATTQQGADNIQAALERMGMAGAGLVLDVNQEDSVQALMARVKKDFSAPTILVNNAGITRDNLFIRMKEDDWKQVVDTNLSSMYRLCRACLRDMMKARAGRIVNISSVVALSGNAGQTNYAAAKAGIIGFTKSLAQEVGPRGITVNVVAPGFIATDMTDKLSASQQEALLDKIPVGRMGTVRDIARVVRFLVAEDSGYITGETVHVNGGLYMV